jgi:PKD repeat protein
MPDGSVSNPIPVQFETPIYLDVMGDSYSGQDYDLDNGPDTPLVITQASSGYGSTANKAYGGSEVYYYPGTLDYGDTDQVTYTISDGADTDTATAYIKIVEKTGTVTFNNPDLDDGQAAVNPSWEGPEEFGWTPISDVYQFTVTLDEEAKLFSVPRNENHVRVLDGSRQLVDGDDWITKEVPVQDLTTNDWSALLGRTYTEYLNQSPVAEIGLVTFDSGCQGGAPCTLEMSNESTDPDGDPLTYNWDFDNGNESTAETPTQTYANNGTYNVKLTANDGELSHTDTCKITLGSEAPGGHEANCGSFILGVNETPTASINLTQLDSNGADHEYQFDASGSSDPDGFIASYEWEVINIVNSSGGAVSIYSFIDSSATVTDGTFTNPHDDTTITYTAQLTVTDDDGYTGTATRDIDVTCNEVFGGGTSACVSVSGP